MDIPGSQLLIYPMCDPSCSSESYELLSEGYLLTKDNMIWFWDKFRSSEADNINPTFNLFEFDFEKALPPMGGRAFSKSNSKRLKVGLILSASELLNLSQNQIILSFVSK